MAKLRKQDVDELVAFYRGAKWMATRASIRWGRYEVGILVLSVATTGSLWGLLSEALPDVTLWVGAVLATVTAFLSGYTKYTNYHQIMSEALSLHAAIGEFLGEVRASPNMTQEQYWPRHKGLETTLDNLEVRSGFQWRKAMNVPVNAPSADDR